MMAWNTYMTLRDTVSRDARIPSLLPHAA
jgi:hypothetical protein